MAYPKLTPITATGSTAPRYLGDRFADIVNVKDFGAVGDGVADDTAAFTAAQNFDAQAVMVPNGTYKITEDVAGTFFSFGEITTTGGGDVEIIDVLSFDSIANQLDNDIQSKVALDGSNLYGAVVKTVVGAWHLGTEWYRIWSDGWCEQGGSKNYTNVTVNLYKPYIDTNYTVLTSAGDSSPTDGIFTSCISDKATSSFKFWQQYGSSGGGPNTVGYWIATGYIF